MVGLGCLFYFFRECSAVSNGPGPGLVLGEQRGLVSRRVQHGHAVEVILQHLYLRSPSRVASATLALEWLRRQLRHP